MSGASPVFVTALREAREHPSAWVRRELAELDEAVLGRPLSEAEEDRARAYREVLAEREEGER